MHTNTPCHLSSTNLRFTNMFAKLLLLMLLPVCRIVLANDGTILVGGDHDYPPYEFINAEGRPDGYNTELTHAIADVMGIKVQVVLGSWDSIKLRLEQGEIDLVQGVSYSLARTEILGFTPPHSIVHQSVFARKGADEINSLAQLSGKSVIVQRSGIIAEQLAKQNPQIDLVYAETHATALRLLASGQHDYAFVANLPGLYLGKEFSLSNIEPVGQPLAAQQYGYAALKQRQELLAQFSEGLAILKNTGRQQEIYNKWFGPLTNKGLDWEKISMLVGGIALLLLILVGGIMIWNRSLAHQVSRRTKELQLRQQQLIQADKMTSLGILVAGVAHEINNPAGLLLLNLPIVQETFADLDEILEEYYETHGDFYLAGLSYSRIRSEMPLMLQDMLDGTQHISRIVNDLRDFARQEPRELSESVNLNQVVMAAIRLTDNTIRAATRYFSANLADELPLVLGSAQRLQQVIINLIVNACQALESAEQYIDITTTFLPAENRICLAVKDSGRGIQPSQLAHLTAPFFTTKREQGGTGLGLSISAAIVEEHGGQLEFASEPDAGTLVTLYLPVLPESARQQKND